MLPVDSLPPMQPVDPSVGPAAVPSNGQRYKKTNCELSNRIFLGYGPGLVGIRTHLSCHQQEFMRHVSNGVPLAALTLSGLSIQSLVSENHAYLSTLSTWLRNHVPSHLVGSLLGLVLLHCIAKSFLQKTDSQPGSKPLPAVFIDDASDLKRQADQLHLSVLAPFSPLLRHLVPHSTLLNGIWFFRCITHNTEGPMHTAFRTAFKNSFIPEFLKVYNQHGKGIVRHHMEEMMQQLQQNTPVDLKESCLSLCGKLTYLWFVSPNTGADTNSRIENAVFNALFIEAYPDNRTAQLTAGEQWIVEQITTALQLITEQSIEAAKSKNTLGGGPLYDLFNGFTPLSIMGVVAGFLSPQLGFGSVWNSLNTIETPEKMQDFHFRLGMIANVAGLSSQTESTGFAGFHALKQLSDALRLTSVHLPNSLVNKLQAAFKQQMPQLPGLLGNTFAPSAEEVTLFTSVLMVIASTFLTPVALSEVLLSAHQNEEHRLQIKTWRQEHPEEKASRQLMSNVDALLGDHIPFNAVSRVEANGDPVLARLSNNPETNSGTHGFAQGGAHECLGRPLLTAMYADVIDAFFTQAEKHNLALRFAPESDTMQPISPHDPKEPVVFQWRKIGLVAIPPNSVADEINGRRVG